MLDCQRNLFKIPEEVSYLNCAYMSPQLRQVEAVGRDMLGMKNQPWLVTPADFFYPVQELKTTFARLIQIREKDRIAIVPSVSYGMANVAINLHLKKGEKVIVAEAQFPSNYYVWERLCRQYEAEFAVIPAPTVPSRGRMWNSAILDAIDERTRMVAIANVHWADGTLFDLAAIRKRTREVGALLVIDGTQSVGALPLNVGELQPDALVCAGYKWLLGPYSIGLAYYGPYFDEGIPIEENWINRKGSELFSNLVNYQYDYQPLASRFSVGEQSNFLLAPMLKTAIEQLLDWGVDRIQEYCRRLSSGPMAELQELGCIIEEEAWRGSHLVGVRLGNRIDPERLNRELVNRRVMVSQRGNAIRVATNVYNNELDFTRLVDAFRASVIPNVHAV